MRVKKAFQKKAENVKITPRNHLYVRMNETGLWMGGMGDWGWTHLEIEGRITDMKNVYNRWECTNVTKSYYVNLIYRLNHSSLMISLRSLK